MSLFITSLNSGSNGNCYYIGNHKEAILVDVGLSCRETEKRLSRLGLSFKNIKAIFISHEHTDHISGLEAIVKKHELPVYITNATLENSKLKPNELWVKHFSAADSIQIGDLKVTPFLKKHDAKDPHSFIVSNRKTTVGVFTDIGMACKDLVKHFKLCNAAFLETNYDEEMLENGNYPNHLKKRIQGNYGHLSNAQALELFKKHKPKFMSHLILSHLSRDNNSPDLVMDLFAQHAKGTKIIVASRYIESEIYHIQGTTNAKEKIKEPKNRVEQLALF